MAQTTESDRTSSFGAVDGTRYFDLLFYRDIGLDLTTLENPAHEALVPSLRRAAEIVGRVRNTRDNEQMRKRSASLLHTYHTRTKREILHAELDIDWRITEGHPAVEAWRERNEQLEVPDSRPVQELLSKSALVKVGLVHPLPPQSDVDLVYGPTYEATTSLDDYLFTIPGFVADQFTQARVGVWHE